MIIFTLRHTQRGVTMLVTLIMLILITLMVTTAFTISNSNLKSVGNMQFRNEALAAANVAIEQQISSATTFTNPVAKSIVVDSYTVNIAKPECLYTTDVVEQSSADPQANIEIANSAAPPPVVTPAASGSFQNTYWDIAATVDDGMSGALVTAHQGVKITLPSSPNPCS